jgi:hypothetical protein
MNPADVNALKHQTNLLNVIPNPNANKLATANNRVLKANAALNTSVKNFKAVASNASLNKLVAAQNRVNKFLHERNSISQALVRCMTNNKMSRNRNVGI